jgi:hypothetical protein
VLTQPDWRRQRRRVAAASDSGVAQSSSWASSAAWQCLAPPIGATWSWRELLIDIKQRGLEIAPDLAVGDGALGFWKADRAGLSEHQTPAVLGSQNRHSLSDNGRNAFVARDFH